MTSCHTRLAPSPTGSLHLGNVFSFLLNWTLAKQNDWNTVLRIEDIDGPRKKLHTIDETIEILQWLGLDWSRKPIIQSEHLGTSRDLLHFLIEENLAYHCSLSRQEIEFALTAPHEQSVVRSPFYRPKNIQLHNESRQVDFSNWRFVTDQDEQTISDELYGELHFTSDQDFIVWTKSNMPAYQLAVVADDHREKITHVVRGCDLLQSTAWQEQLYRALDWSIPKWFHHPLIVGFDGKRLAKRHGDTRIFTYRHQGIAPERIIGLIAMWSNAQEELNPMSLTEFGNAFEYNRLQQSNIIFTKEDEKWLLGQSS